MKRNHKPKEIDQLQKLKEECRQLKRINQHLRKQLNAVDLTQFDHLREELRDMDYKEQQEKEASFVPTRQCHECQEGVLKLMIIERRDGKWYYRACNNCKNRTRLKRFTKETKA